MAFSSEFKEYFPENLKYTGYKDFNEYFNDHAKVVRLMIDYYALADKNSEFKEYYNFVIEEFKESYKYIISRKSFNDKKFFLALDYLISVYKLKGIELFSLILSLVAEMNNKYSCKKYAKNPDGILELAIKIYYFKEEASEIPDFHEIKIKLKKKLYDLCFDKDSFKVSKRLKSFLFTNGSSEIKILNIKHYVPLDKKKILILEDEAERIASSINKFKTDDCVYLYLNKNQGFGKKTLIKRIGQLTDSDIIFTDCLNLELEDEKKCYEFFKHAFREALLHKAFLCFNNIQVFFREKEEKNTEYFKKRKLLEYLLKNAKKYTTLIFITASDEELSFDRSIIGKKFWLDISLRDIKKDEIITLWEVFLKSVSLSEKIESYELANKFSFLPGQIEKTCLEAARLAAWEKSGKLNKKDIYKCAYLQVINKLGNQATLIESKNTWEELILPDAEKEMLRSACDQIKFRHIVYDKWQFKKRLIYGTGLSMLFAGLPGTGKTMAALVVANELDIEIYKVNLSQVVSKYIGETEKNLNSLFEEAKRSNVILFFDETDAILGKRTEVKDSHDKNANLETSFLLQKMEEFEGITVLSTNFLQNIDKAFFRRINYVINFPFPDFNSRKLIWQNIFPKEAPLDKNIDFNYLSSQFELSGGSIKNIAVNSAFIAAKNNTKINMSNILKSVKYELTKQGKVLLKDDFGEHGYLLE